MSPPPERPWPLEMLSIALSHPWLLAGTLIPAIAAPAIEPAQAWLAKTALDRLTSGQDTLLRDELIQFLPLVVGVFFVLGSVKLVGKLLDKAFDARLIIDLQRIYFERRGETDPSEHVTRTLNDCEQARKVFDLLQKDIWQLVIGLPAVLIWQLQIGPEWILPLLLATLPTLAFTLLFGPLVQLWSHRQLLGTVGVGMAAGRGERDDFHQRQEHLFGVVIRFEVVKQAAEVIGDMTQWLGLAVILLISPLIPIIPHEISAGALAAFLVNLKLIGKPVQELGKMYIKLRESYPAVLRVLQPHRALALDLGVAR